MEDTGLIVKCTVIFNFQGLQEPLLTLLEIVHRSYIIDGSVLPCGSEVA